MMAHLTCRSQRYWGCRRILAWKWTCTCRSWMASKSAAGLDPRILHATLALRKSLTEHGGDNVEVVGNQGLTFGSSVPYGGFHKTGTANMPKRDPMDFSTGCNSLTAPRYGPTCTSTAAAFGGS